MARKLEEERKRVEEEEKRVAAEKKAEQDRLDKEIEERRKAARLAREQRVRVALLVACMRDAWMREGVVVSALLGRCYIYSQS